MTDPDLKLAREIVASRYETIGADGLALAIRHGDTLAGKGAIDLCLAAIKAGRAAGVAETMALLKDPAAVRINYLRGNIACQPLLDEARATGAAQEREICAKEAEWSGCADGYYVAAVIRKGGEHE